MVDNISSRSSSVMFQCVWQLTVCQTFPSMSRQNCRNGFCILLSGYPFTITVGYMDNCSKYS